jgi:hypothetical protein
MQITVISVTFLIGLALIVVAIFGGGIEIREIKIPTLPVVSRTLSFLAGLVLVVLCVMFPQIFPNSAANPVPLQNSAEDKSKGFLGAAIQNHLMSVRDVKTVLRHLGKYTGPINDEANDAYFQAVGEFQVSQNVPADGLVGPVTYAKLREAWPEYFGSK